MDADDQIFERVLCGVDGSPEGLDAALQAARLAAGRLVLVTALDPWDVVIAGEAGEAGQDQHTGSGSSVGDQAADALDEARRHVEGLCEVEARLLTGRAQDVLLAEAEREGATLLVVGTHGRSRALGIALGSVATALVHRAPCPVLLARATSDPESFPRGLVVGLDGSPESESALAVGRLVRARFGVTVRAVIATKDRSLRVDDARRAAGADAVHLVDARPVEALVDAAGDADLLLVGSRGLHGVDALGSVSERVAHRAPCSVLVLRPRARREPPSTGRRVVVRDIMTTPVIVAREETTVEEIAKLMLEHEVGAMPIVDAGGRLVGIVTETDFLGREIAFARSYPAFRVPRLFGEWVLGDRLEQIYQEARSLPAHRVMSSPVVTAAEDEPIQQVAERMIHEDVNRMPVVRQGVPVGMVARHDLLRFAVKAWREPAPTRDGA